MKVLLFVCGVIVGAGAVIGFIAWAAWQKVKHDYRSD